MLEALAQAHTADAAGEVPVGAVVVYQGQIIATGRNAPIATTDPTAHAEIAALRGAALHLGNYRLDGCELFVTLEPCAMCAGAMLHARLRRLVFGASDPKTGTAGSVIDLFANQQLNHQTQVRGGVMADQCATLLQSFFKRQRTGQQRNRQMQGRAVRPDALRTPEACFEALPDQPAGSHFVNDLPSLSGLRMHYIDTGPQDAATICLCLHSTHNWSYGWRHLVTQHAALGQRIICPDLIGFGKSDKPKKEAFHSLRWHAQVLLELLERLDLRHITLLVPHGLEELSVLLGTRAPERIEGVVRQQAENLNPLAMNAPYPDSGHRAAWRAFSAMTITSVPNDGRDLDYP